MEPALISVSDACDSCGACVRACPQDVLELRPKAVAEWPQRCIRCGHCVAVCPRDAVTHGDYGPGTLALLDYDRLPTPEALATLFLARRSQRVFSDRPVSPAVIEELINRAVPSYPSAHNAQPIGIIAVTDAARLENLRRATGEYYGVILKRLRNPFLRGIYGAVAGAESLTGTYAMADGMARLVADLAARRDTLFNGAPALLLFYAPKTAVMPHDAATAAATQITLMAACMGLATCHIGYFTAAAQDADIRALMHLPRGASVLVTLALGYPADRFRYGIRRLPPPITWY